MTNLGWLLLRYELVRLKVSSPFVEVGLLNFSQKRKSSLICSVLEYLHKLGPVRWAWPATSVDSSSCLLIDVLGQVLNSFT